MASTRTLQNVVNWAQMHCRLMPLTGIGGVAGEPALSIANSVLCFILGPPFAWRWNRASLTAPISTVAGTQSYQTSLTKFGWIESATVNDGATTYDLEVRMHIEDSDDSGRPTHIAAELDDDSGNITFKLYPVPDKVYTLNVISQNKPTLFTGLAGKWAPIPDEYQHLYNSGFLAGAFEYIDDARFVPEYQKFLKTVIAASEGLTDTQKEIFLTEKLLATRQQENAQMGPQQGRSSRGSI